MKNTLLLGTHKGLIIYEHTSGAWRRTRQAFIGVPVPYAMLDHRTGIMWASLDHGHWGQKLHRSYDMGKTWQEIPAPKFPAGAMTRPDKPASVRYLWCIVPGGNDQPQRLYIGTEPGGLFVSDDGGNTWQLNMSLWNHPSRIAEQWFGGGRDDAGIDAIVVDPRNSKRVLIAVSVAGVFETIDDGATWHPRNKGLKANYLPNDAPEVGHDPHFMAACPANVDVLWQQNHCGIFRSVDGAKTWHDISQPGGPAYFGFPVAVDEQNPNTAWVVPAISDEVRVAINDALVVCRTEDGGETWQELRNGLPQSHCYDIVFRHALDITGSRLAFGTTTGSVYVSDDRGDQWSCLGDHFPGVLSVRFA